MNGGVLSVEFAEEISIGDHGIVRREMVALVIERANLDLGSEDDASVRVENRGIGFVAKRSVGEHGDIRVRRIGEMKAANGITHLLASTFVCGHTFQLTRTPSIPTRFVFAISNMFSFLFFFQFFFFLIVFF